MNENNLFNQDNIKGKVFFAFSGLMSEEVINIFINGIEAQLTKISENNSKAMNILVIFVEVMQNVIKYQKNHLQEDYDSLYVIVVQDLQSGQLVVQACNLIATADKKKVSEKIDYVNGLDKDGLRQAYRSLRKAGDLVHDKGAGLGFLEIRKLASKSLEYQFKSRDDKYERFLFQVTV